MGRLSTTECTYLPAYLDRAQAVAEPEPQGIALRVIPIVVPEAFVSACHSLWTPLPFLLRPRDKAIVRFCCVSKRCAYLLKVETES